MFKKPETLLQGGFVHGMSVHGVSDKLTDQVIKWGSVVQNRLYSKEIYTWCYHKPHLIILSPCRVSNPTHLIMMQLLKMYTIFFPISANAPSCMEFFMAHGHTIVFLTRHCETFTQHKLHYFYKLMSKGKNNLRNKMWWELNVYPVDVIKKKPDLKALQQMRFLSNAM